MAVFHPLRTPRIARDRHAFVVAEEGNQLTKMNRLVAVPAPILCAITFGTGLAIDHFLPWNPRWMDSLDLIGWILIAVGIALGPGSAVLFMSKRTTLNPAGRPSGLVTVGAFQVSRNPMYLGLAVGYVGLAIVIAQLWPIVLLPLPLFFLNLVVVPFEEGRLEKTFADDFLAYRQRVRRWL